MKPLPKKMQNAILHDYLAGEKVLVIAAKYGVHHSTASQLARKRGLPRRSKTRVRRAT